MRRFFLAPALGLLCLGMPFQGIARADAETGSTHFAAPKDLSPCAPDDPVATMESRVAPSIGGQFVNCFHSDGRGEASQYAFTIRLGGGPYAQADLDKLLATVTAQWKDFQPLGKEFHETYVARINALARDAGETSSTIASVKPVLVSIERLDAKSYSVVSIRSYVFNDSGGKQARTVKVNADAVVLRGSDLIRLTMQRVLAKAADVDQLRGEISQWARATEEPTP